MWEHIQTLFARLAALKTAVSSINLTSLGGVATSAFTTYQTTVAIALAAKAAKPVFAAAPAINAGVLTIDMQGAQFQKLAYTIVGWDAIQLAVSNHTVAPSQVSVLILITCPTPYTGTVNVTPKLGSGLRVIDGGVTAPMFDYSPVSQTRALHLVFNSNGQGDVLVAGLPYGAAA